MDDTWANRLKTIDALLDTLIPGAQGSWPSAAMLDLAERFIDEASRAPGVAEFARILKSLPADFARLDRAAREAALHAQPTALVQALAAAAYRVYYTNPVVAEHILTQSRPV
jgi:hypothetical protein